MIYTLTVNPSLDYVIKLKNFEAGGIYRTNEEELIYGGKGVNVSVMLHNLGIESLALGFVEACRNASRLPFMRRSFGNQIGTVFFVS